MSSNPLPLLSFLVRKSLSVALIGWVAVTGVQAHASDASTTRKNVLDTQFDASLPPSGPIGTRPLRPLLSSSASAPSAPTVASSVAIEGIDTADGANGENNAKERQGASSTTTMTSSDGWEDSHAAAQALSGGVGVVDSSRGNGAGTEPSLAGSTSAQGNATESGKASDTTMDASNPTSNPSETSVDTGLSSTATRAPSSASLKGLPLSLATTIQSNATNPSLPRAFGFDWPLVLAKFVGPSAGNQARLQIEQSVRAAEDSPDVQKGSIVQVQVDPALRWTPGQEVFALIEPFPTSASNAADPSAQMGLLVRAVKATPQNALMVSRWALQGAAKKNAAQWLYAVTGMLSLFAILCWGMRNGQGRPRSAQQLQRLVRWGFQCSLGCVWSDLAYWTVRDPAVHSMVDLWVMFPALCVGAGLAFAFLREIQLQKSDPTQG